MLDLAQGTRLDPRMMQTSKPMRPAARIRHTLRNLLRPAAALMLAALVLPLPASAQSSRAQLAEVAEALRKYTDIRTAKAEGWKAFGGDEPLMGQHFYPPNGPDYVAGDKLDFSRPNNLMYTEIDGRMVLTGAAFVVRLGPDDPLPDGFAGRADRWHVHDFQKAIDAATEDRPVLGGIANWWLDRTYYSKGDNRARLAMVHAWVTMPNPDGPFADFNRLLAYRKLGLPDSWASGASIESARGLVLAQEGGCERRLEGDFWIANIKGQQKRRILTGCEQVAAKIRADLPGTKARVNARAAEGHAVFERFLAKELTADQKRRIAAMAEHGDHGNHADHAGHGQAGAHAHH
ncbi:hypothetical protein [Oceanomicrobium pacificus]|uniref:Uncharacterized protein n=1 Tax=Oceanomicrobium pacificus TaxID=2692916 RepID=A0A6B0U401_9RHOB|nr:hypothetical protein [Oceanomicrobium pacificus]MXU65671.1 hypothetical protein [Oceanomicrobium pacificus]